MKLHTDQIILLSFGGNQIVFHIPYFLYISNLSGQWQI